MPETSLPTCYRHPDRETRLSCSVCERPICTECMTSAAVGQRCPACAQPSGRSRVISAQQALQGGMSTAVFTKGVIGVCVAVFLIGLVGLQQDIFVLGAQHNPSVAAGEYWRLVTSMFLHGGVAHVAMNMLLLWILGPAIERGVGPWAFAALYLGSGLTGAAAYFFLGGVTPAVGASGAVFGLFGAWLAAGLRNRHNLQGSMMLRQIVPLVLINLVISFLPGLNIAWQAHLGGFVAGFAITFAWGWLGRDQTGARLAVGAVVGALALLAVIAG
jgi:membrane associated rhomboid family serine protease